jgi:hypothetical protein
MDIFVGARFTANYTAISTKPSVDNFVATYVQNIASPPTPPTPGSGGSAPPAIGPQGVDYNPGIEPTRNII